MTSSVSPGNPASDVTILCPHCRKPNTRRRDQLLRAKFCQHCGRDVVLNNDGPRYYITRVIKEGGQGAVYEAVDDQFNVYAVKEMLDRFFDPKERAEAIGRFETEARMLQAFRHPRIPRVYADFKDDERHYLVMDFVRGEDLEDVIKREGRISEAQALIWADQICDVLALLHNQNPPIIFRDMKPSNIMIEREGNGVKLIDFGIAKVFQSSVRGTQIGTPGYAPPEQYQGIAAVQSDMYALGATLHHMLTGRDPRDYPTEMFKFPPVRSLNPTISERTAQAIEKALQSKIEDRYTTIAEFRAALKPGASPAPRPSIPAQVPVQPPKPQPAPAQQQPRPQPVPTQQQPAQAARPGNRVTPQVIGVPQPAGAGAGQAGVGGVPGQQPQQKAKGRFPWGRVIFGLIAVVLIAATIFLFPGITSSLPTFQTSTPTAQVMTQVTYTITDQVVFVPVGQDVTAAYRETFLTLARQSHGPQALINANAPPSFIGQPEKISEDANGTTYKATMQGFVLIPRQ